MKTGSRRFCAAVAAMACGVAGASARTTLAFDELASQPVDGLSLSGLTFRFEVGGSPSADASFNVDVGLGDTQFLSGPVLEGDAAGFLLLLFDYPAIELSFGLGYNVFADLAPGASVALYDTAGLIVDSISFDTLANPAVGISEGRFEWKAPGAGAAKAVVDFLDPAGRFALDNLRFETIPEPGTMSGGVVISGLAIAGYLSRRRT